LNRSTPRQEYSRSLLRCIATSFVVILEAHAITRYGPSPTGKQTQSRSFLAESRAFPPYEVLLPFSSPGRFRFEHCLQPPPPYCNSSPHKVSCVARLLSRFVVIVDFFIIVYFRVPLDTFLLFLPHYAAAVFLSTYHLRDRSFVFFCPSSTFMVVGSFFFLFC